MPGEPRRRATAERLAGRRRSAFLAERIGVGLRESRIAMGLRQADAAAKAGVSQPFWSRLERGGAGSASLATLAACAASVDAQLAAFLQAVPGSSLPRDLEHLRRQQLVISLAGGGGWRARAERPIDPAARWSRSIDVELVREIRREIAVVEIEDLLNDGGHAMRRLADKVAAVRRVAAPGWIVSGLLVLRATHRNRRTVHDFSDVFAARFGGSSSTWLTALRHPDRAMPTQDGIVWSSVDGGRLMAVRFR